MRIKVPILLLLSQLSLASAQQPQWKLQSFMEYFGHEPGTSLGTRVKGFVGSRSNNPYNVAVVEGYNPTIGAARLLFYHITFPQDTIPRWIVPGGANVVHGDFNGDGLTDLAIQKSVNVERNDTVMIYLGNAVGIDTIPSFKLPAEQERSGFGREMCVGDLNNDQIDDLVITAPGYYVSSGNNGKVYVYFGNPKLQTVPDITITGGTPEAGLGSRCAIGDFNGDGFNDLAIRGFYQSGTGFSYGYLNIYFGSTNFDAVPDLISPRASTAFIADDLAAFDVNGDQHTDLLWTFADSSQRAVFIHNGGEDFQERFQSEPDFIIPAPVAGLFGNEIKNAGDMNGDGYDDIAIAAFAFGQQNGIVFIYTTGKGFDNQFDAARGQSLDGNFGTSISAIGDINQDGYSDIIVGAPEQPWSRNEGYFGIFLGDPRIPTSVKNPSSEVVEPFDFVLEPGFPNPSKQAIIFNLGVKQRALFEATVFNLLGREVRNLLRSEFAAGNYQILWDGKNHEGEDVPAGIYFVRIKAFVSSSTRTVFEKSQKFIVVR